MLNEYCALWTCVFLGLKVPTTSSAVCWSVNHYKGINFKTKNKEIHVFQLAEGSNSLISFSWQLQQLQGRLGEKINTRESLTHLCLIVWSTMLRDLLGYKRIVGTILSDSWLDICTCQGDYTWLADSFFSFPFLAQLLLNLFFSQEALLQLALCQGHDWKPVH